MSLWKMASVKVQTCRQVASRQLKQLFKDITEEKHCKSNRTKEGNQHFKQEKDLDSEYYKHCRIWPQSLQVCTLCNSQFVSAAQTTNPFLPLPVEAPAQRPPNPPFQKTHKRTTPKTIAWNNQIHVTSPTLSFPPKKPCSFMMQGWRNAVAR